MNIYTEKKYYLYQVKLEIIENDTLLLAKKTPLGYSKETAPLVAFSTKCKVIKRTLSFLARSLLILEFLIIIGFFAAFFRYPEYFLNINLPLILSIIAFFLYFSVFYYICETKSKLYFYYYNGEPAFTLSHNRSNLEQRKWIEQFNGAIRKARIDFDHKNFTKIRTGINNLKRQRLINEQFAEELHLRLSLLNNTKIN
ncbi:hypothetical protein DGG96_16645 [Legionella qingyii]|uniref:Uncharacterized protein n=1 Tax=Legionella qingyii TaxID=2184757 RepID=A0A317TY29_9GAMM|nr:hypothetical protein [Legionella qingyii]PWY54514.1 hypothetical protein DGG96_16645 [Legionella qingyii]RUR19407.1 hypothetical protein ELY20_15845 [Legionella qingyii]RUR22913.1 hypothetical protein ELY16_14215 [Legionella qingyii]